MGLDVGVENVLFLANLITLSIFSNVSFFIKVVLVADF